MTRLSDNERAMLLGMAPECGSDDYPWCLNFSGIAVHCPVHPSLIRRTVRALARKGLTEYAKGLWDEDGHPRGAGYTLTPAGRALVAQLEDA